jgi:hypothetical protein
VRRLWPQPRFFSVPVSNDMPVVSNVVVHSIDKREMLVTDALVLSACAFAITGAKAQAVDSKQNVFDLLPPRAEPTPPPGELSRAT